jgi:hypothetical protein
MAVVGARARLELVPTTRRWFLSATRSCAARASPMSRGEESRLAETKLASDHRRTHSLTSGAKRREHRLSTKFSPDGGANVRLST